MSVSVFSPWALDRYTVHSVVITVSIIDRKRGLSTTVMANQRLSATWMLMELTDR